MLNAFIAAIAVVSSALPSQAASSRQASDMPEFQRALKLGVQDRVKPALQIVDRLLTKKATDVPVDRLLMTKARLHFQQGEVKIAGEIYERIPSDSDYWLESLEERAWSHLRQGEHGASLAQLRTFKAPLFASLIGPEPYFVEGLTQLKICAYPKVFEAVKNFKENYRGRMMEMQALANSGTSAAATDVIEKLRSAPLTWKTVAPDATKLPRLFYRDRQFIADIEAMKAGRATAAGQAQRRLKELASRDLKEIQDILQKMHLLEAEVIQRIHIAEKPKGRANRDLRLAKGEEVLIFNDDGEDWLDEAGQYRVNVQGCPTATGGQKL